MTMPRMKEALATAGVVGGTSAQARSERREEGREGREKMV